MLRAISCARMRTLLRVFACISIQICPSVTFTGELFPYHTVNDCKNQEFYSISTLTCKHCAKEKFLTPSDNKLSCLCNNKSIIAKWDGEFPVCAPCNGKEEPTRDQMLCMSCPLDKANNPKCSNLNYTVCSSNEILADFQSAIKIHPT